MRVINNEGVSWVDGHKVKEKKLLQKKNAILENIRTTFNQSFYDIPLISSI